MLVVLKDFAAGNGTVTYEGGLSCGCSSSLRCADVQNILKGELTQQSQLGHNHSTRFDVLYTIIPRNISTRSEQ